MKTEGQNVTLTFEELQQLLAGQQAAQMESLKEFARELKAPDPETAEAIAKEKARKEEARQRRIAEIKMEQEAKEQGQAMCEKAGHLKDNGRTAVVQGQVHNDSHFHPFCLRCGKKFAPFKATVEAMTA